MLWKELLKGTEKGKWVGDPSHGAADGGGAFLRAPQGAKEIFHEGNGSLQGNSDLRNVPLVGHSLAQNL